MFFQILKLIANPKFIQCIGGIILLLIIYNVVVGETRVPEHCIKNTEENKAILGAFKVTISNEYSRSNEICFQTKDSNLVAQINEQVQDVELKKYIARLESKEKFWDKYFYPILIAVVVVVIVLGWSYMNSPKDYY